MKAEDIELWKEVTASVRPLGSTAPRDPMPSAPMHLRVWPFNPAPTSLDLHGLTLAQAFDTTKRFIYHTRQAGLKNVMIITGRSGAICAEFPAWMSSINPVSRFEKLENGGSFRVHLRKYR